MSSKGTKAGLGVFGILLIAATIFFSITHKSSTTTLNKPLALAPQTKPVNDAPAIPQQPPAPTNIHPHKFDVKHGDTLASIFHDLKLSAATLEAVTASSLANQHLTQIRPGQTLTFYIDRHHQLQQLVFPFDNISTLFINSSSTGYTTDIKSKPVTIALKYMSGTVKYTLSGAAMKAGLNVALYHQLTGIFQGSIDFRHNIRHGDNFKLLFKEYYIDGKRDHPGAIMAAEFTNRGKTYTAIRYTYPKNHTGYYTPDGHGVQSLFLKTPVHYKRISSYFTYHRMDPYLHVMRPHLGIDYAAPEGTPIHSIGNGRILFRGRDHGYGNAMVIRYSRKYKTLYGHMEHFAKGQYVGAHVKRGEVIGYIGSTGWSTGPHLHFEMYVYGVPKDPLKLKFPGGKSIPASYTNDYLAYAQKMLARINLYQGPELAKNGKTTLKK